MATTLSNATFTSTITESVTLNNVTTSSTQTLSIANVNEFDKRIVNVPTSSINLIGFGSANGVGTFLRTAVKYIRITNLDDTNFVTIGVIDTGGDVFYVKLEAGKSFFMGSDDLEADTSGGSFSAWSEADFITALADTAAVDVEYMVVSI